DGRDDHLVDGHRLLANAEDVWDGMSVDVRVEHADLLAGLSERDSEVRRQCRLADPTLAAAHGEHACRRIERATLRTLLQSAAQLRRQRLPLFCCHHVEPERDALDAGDVTQYLGNLFLE